MLLATRKRERHFRVLGNDDVRQVMTYSTHIDAAISLTGRVVYCTLYGTLNGVLVTPDRQPRGASKYERMADARVGGGRTRRRGCFSCWYRNI
jgi:hypothetical protein